MEHRTAQVCAPTAMETSLRSLLLSYISVFFFFSGWQFFTYSTPLLPIGIHPLDEKYFASEVIKCKDGSNSFSRDRINDNFCDCLDGTDEPGTSACPAGKFYCRNVGSTPQFLFSSRVNDHICDCCDGSDEYERRIICPNTCVMGGNIEYKSTNYGSKLIDHGSVDTHENKIRLDTEDSVHHFKGLESIDPLAYKTTVFCAIDGNSLYFAMTV
ncbi:hypothetical protein LguiA_035118 [Lonicera macranthoides]